MDKKSIMLKKMWNEHHRNEKIFRFMFKREIIYSTKKVLNIKLQKLEERKTEYFSYLIKTKNDGE